MSSQKRQLAQMHPNPINEIISGTVLAMAGPQKNKDLWRNFIEETLVIMMQNRIYWKDEIEFFEAILDILSSRTVALGENHTYSQQLVQIQNIVSFLNKRQL